MSKLLRWLMQWVNIAIYVWSATGENVCAQLVEGAYDPEGWIISKEQTEAKAKTAIALYRDRVAEGLNPVIAFDCSGLVTCLLRFLGILKPTARLNTKGLYAKCNSHPKRSELREGDLVFKSDTGKAENITHVGVYVGNGEVIESKGRAYGVVKTNINDYPWNMYGRIDAIEPFTQDEPLPEKPMSLAVYKPVLSGEPYRIMQEALNALGYTDADGNVLTVDGKWGKRSRQAWDKAVAENLGVVSLGVSFTIEGVCTKEFTLKEE